MPYKIVQTIERGKKTLVIVPSLWEDKGNLWWPPKKFQYKLMKDDKSKPSRDWKLIKCTLKRNDIPTYQLADDELSLMEENSDTEGPENNTSIEVQPRESFMMPTEEEINFDVMANNLICDQEIPHENVMQIVSAETLNFDQILVNQKSLSDKIDQMLQIQATVIENQRKITRELAAQSLQLEEVALKLAEIKGPTSINLLKDVNAVDNESFSLKAIENQRELTLLDQTLADKEKRNKLRRQLSFVCSVSQGKGITCAYKLLDILFTREFLCLCSWTGGSRGDRSKIGLKDYKNVLKFFCTMIQSWDPTYTIQENEKFFKLVTKNSTQRKCMKNVRMSSKRCRRNVNKKLSNTDVIDIEVQASNDNAKENEAETEGENMQVQEVAMERENVFFNNVSDADDENFDGLC